MEVGDGVEITLPPPLGPPSPHCRAPRGTMISSLCATGASSVTCVLRQMRASRPKAGIIAGGDLGRCNDATTELGSVRSYSSPTQGCGYTGSPGRFPPVAALANWQC
jgi:hypothetical protein